MSDEQVNHTEEILTPEIVEAMGVSMPAFEEVQCIIGRMPTVQELSTLLAMWDANGRQQSLYGWLKGQHHMVEKREYLYDGDDQIYKNIKEPKVKECIALAHDILDTMKIKSGVVSYSQHSLLYIVGNVSTEFLNSEYARRCLHIVDDPIKMTTVDEDVEYLDLILGSLQDAGVLLTRQQIGFGGLFVALLSGCNKVGFDILTCREIRLDSFLFGEEAGRFIVSLPDSQDDFFLTKMDEARINCCFLGHVTKGRILVDDFDFGDIKQWI